MADEEKEIEEGSSPSEEESQEEKTEEEQEGKTVPYERFKEIYKKGKDLEQEVSSLKAKGQEGGLSADEKKELDAKVYLKKIAKEAIDEIEASKAEVTKKEQQTFDDEVAETLDINPDVKKADFLKFIEKEAQTYGIDSVEGAMKLYKKFNEVSKDASEKTKKDIASKPGLPKHEGGGGETPPDDSKKSLYQIVADDKKELTK